MASFLPSCCVSPSSFVLSDFLSTAFCFYFLFFFPFLTSFPSRFLSHRLFVRYIHEFIVARFFVTVLDLLLYLICLDIRSLLRTSFRIRLGFIESYVVSTICLCIYLCLSSGVPRNFVRGEGGFQQIQLRTEDRENGDLGAVAL